MKKHEHKVINSFPSQKWKKLYKCKKGKGDHVFVALGGSYYSWSILSRRGNYFVELECSVCGKNKTDIFK